MNIPTIDGVRGIFDIFVPGLFLLVNLAAAVFPFIDEDTQKFILDSASNPVLSLVIMVCFGYLLGVILRLFRVGAADNFSARFNRLINPNAKATKYLFSWEDVPGDDDGKLKRHLKDDFDIEWAENAEIHKNIDGKTIKISRGENSAEMKIDEKKEKATLKIHKGKTHKLKVKKKEEKLKIYKIYKKKFTLWAYEDFPYIKCIGKVCESSLPYDVLKFYGDIWARGFLERGNWQFFNFCKAVINFEDERVTSEINYAGALIHYIAGILYALLIAFVVLFVTAILRVFVLGENISTLWLIGLILLAYSLAVLAILINFRFIRIKEVELVFAATFKYRSCIKWEW